MGQTVVVPDDKPAELFVVVALPEPLAVGQLISRRAWPAHVTLASNFVVDDPRDAVLGAVRDACAGESPLDLRFAGEAWFGPRHDVAVQLVDSVQIQTLHGRLADMLQSLDGFAADEPAYWREGYRPHMTHVAGVRTPAGAHARLPFVAIAVMSGSTATVVSTFVLGRDVSA